MIPQECDKKCHVNGFALLRELSCFVCVGIGAGVGLRYSIIIELEKRGNQGNKEICLDCLSCEISVIFYFFSFYSKGKS